MIIKGHPQLQHIGKPKAFDIKTFMQFINDLMDSDEIENALKAFDLIPSYYKDFPNESIEQLKKDILNQVVTIDDYCNNFSQEEKENVIAHERQFAPNLQTVGDMIDYTFTFPRGALVKHHVEKLNKEGKTPHITELGPAQYWLPFGLKKYDCRFTYKPITINKTALKTYDEDLRELNNIAVNVGEPNFFVCFETIEHLKNPSDIKHYYSKEFRDKDADLIFISTPKHTLLGGHQKPWRERPIEHLRTYTPNQLFDFCNESWPFYEWTFYDAAMMVFVGELKK